MQQHIVHFGVTYTDDMADGSGLFFSLSELSVICNSISRLRGTQLDPKLNV